MGGKDKGVATEVKPDMGKDKTYKSPEFFGYNDMSFYDIEASVEKQRCPQPKSGLTEYWQNLLLVSMCNFINREIFDYIFVFVVRSTLKKVKSSLLLDLLFEQGLSD